MADFSRNRMGVWPKESGGRIPGYPGRIWSATNCALRRGSQRLALSEAAIVEWAKAHQARTGDLPTSRSGWVTSYGEKWMAIDTALRLGQESHYRAALFLVAIALLSSWNGS
jgi:hypothetical protein